jgi:hypothetical protein
MLAVRRRDKSRWWKVRREQHDSKEGGAVTIAAVGGQHDKSR